MSSLAWPCAEDSKQTKNLKGAYDSYETAPFSLLQVLASLILMPTQRYTCSGSAEAVVAARLAVRMESAAHWVGNTSSSGTRVVYVEAGTGGSQPYCRSRHSVVTSTC